MTGAGGTGARIESFFLPGPAGRLECLLRHPPGPERAAAAIVCHPHPLFGGTMHNKVVHAAADALVGLGLPALRFNFRGVGRSAGRHDGGRGETEDLATVLDHLAARLPDAAIILAGYSFGAWVGLRVGTVAPRIAGLIGIAAPIGLYDFRFLRDCRRPLVLIQGEADPFAPLGLALAAASVVPGGARVVPIAGAEHGFLGHLEEVAEQVSRAASDHLADNPSDVRADDPSDHLADDPLGGGSEW